MARSCMRVVPIGMHVASAESKQDVWGVMHRQRQPVAAHGPGAAAEQRHLPQQHWHLRPRRCRPTASICSLHMRPRMALAMRAPLLWAWHPFRWGFLPRDRTRSSTQ